ncbi:flavin-containing monooxygenase [Acinetobacter vivianii]|uniref:flavin-containing monooxygenase n=1 Tax=Acinetobacter vivianii TaxID=1776742 RepID=UPI002DB9EDBD|nr:NAD(P)/FAD-dependent oxidoreductase [Acinetobacter vivianii]MEB6479977.1 NAD(P)/FAD-dependent oxidoreductase [Acinetobacter vivianii]MEB6658261.1 NAD(P)/FAD-dependent oxidoreductase [Acinetobacter vivianii]
MNMKSKAIPFHRVIVIGGGFAGLGAAIKLKEAGIHDFILLEKADELGGVWRENTYPGCACDVPSALYSYSFEPNPSWSRVFAGQAEIKQYLQNTAQKYQVLPHVYFQHEALAASWSDQQQCWIVRTNQGEFHAQFTIMACGPMHEPVIPDVNGLKDFKGEIFHSSRWRHDLDLTGKRVAVIGTGASAIQFIPQIQPLVKQLTVFQRTPHWVLPKSDMPLPRPIQTVFKYLPVAQSLMRGSVYGIFETLNGGLQSNAAMQQVQRIAEFHIKQGIKDAELRRKVTPNYVIGCKRILQSNEWYPALARPNVEVVAAGLSEVKDNRLFASDGRSVEADVIILGTGFEVAEPPIAQRVFNRHGQSMSEVWQGSPEGYMGTMVADCPNGFLMFGPNIAVSSSAFIIIEAQLAYIIDALKQAIQQNIQTIEPDPVRMAQFNQRVQEALKTTVWNKGGCQSYFIDRNGRNSTVWPWTTFKMRQQLSHFNLNEYLIDRQVEPQTEPV